MRPTIIYCLTVFFSLISPRLLFGQDSIPSDTSYWHSGFKGIVTFNQSAFKNWQAGGENTVAAASRVEIPLNYIKNKIHWSNALRMRYGFTNQRSGGFRKTQDLLAFESNFGYYFQPDLKKWLWTTSLNFGTQFTDGFNYPNDSMKISAFMAPGYLLDDTGIQYREGDTFSVIYSPLASKWTFVQDDSLSAAGAFGVEPGQTFRDEFGTSLNVAFNKEITKNVTYDSKLILFTNYEEDFGNIDVFWNNLLVFQINNILAATLSMDFIYDDDIVIQEKDSDGTIIGEGPRLQYKQAFGLGLTTNGGRH